MYYLVRIQLMIFLRKIINVQKMKDIYGERMKNKLID